MPLGMAPPPEIDMREVDRAIQKAMTKTLDRVEAMLEVGYFNWESENQPKFQTKQYETVGNLVVEYSTEDTPYIWVDQGTEAHVIEAKFAAFLSFTTDSQPKTTPGRMTSFAGFGGSNWVRAKKVNHPGIEPRDFCGQVAEAIEPEMLDYFDRYFAECKSL